MSKPNVMWWVPAMEAEIAKLEAATAGLADSAVIRPPFGDSRPTTVARLRQDIASKRAEIAHAWTMFAEGKYADGSPIE